MPILLLAGCWQKIEYSPPSASTRSTDAPRRAASVLNAPADAKHVALELPHVAPTGPTATDIRSAAAAQTLTASEPSHVLTQPILNPKPKVNDDDDRYAVPSKESDFLPAVRSTVIETPPSALSQSPPAARKHESKHTDATPASATVDVTPRTTPAASLNTRRAAWLLGCRLSYAALAHDRGMATDQVPGWFEEARAQAKLLGISVPDLPDPAAADDQGLASSRVIDYLLGQGKRICRELSQRYGADDAACLEVALKSSMLLLLYRPGSTEGNSISAAISRAAPQAGLPADLWQPLVDLIALQAPQADVQAAVRKLNSDVDHYLANAGEPSGR
ncbi:MAG TPA: hypothetical protein VHE81_02630 [Lacipirellulaceae bacterium]|nr:hypothetical protein [Lacipirellulaceae bacterium]